MKNGVMKNGIMIVALVLAMVCSQACAQKKSESANANKASAGSKVVPAASLIVSKKSKEAPAKTSEEADAKGARSQKQSKSKQIATEKSASKSDSQEELDDEQRKKVKSMLRQTIKPFAAVDLTEEQRQKADEVLAKAVKDYVVKRSKAEITDQLQKKQLAAMKAMKTSNKSAREQAKEAFASAGFSEEQVKVFKATQASLNKAKREVGKLLTEEQIESLPETLQAVISGEDK